MSGKGDRDLEISASAVDAEALVARIREEARRRREAGDSGEDDFSKLAELDYGKDLKEEDFLRYYLQVVERLADVNYGDFEIVSKGGAFGRAEVFLKKTIWKLLRFYTYRLFSQQREFDCQVAEALKSQYLWSRGEILALREEVADLRRQLREGEKSTP